MKKYKYWIYYHKKSNSLYAYTDNKKYAKEFEKMRDMEKFDIVSEEIDQNTLNYLAKNYQGKYLKKIPIKIYDMKNKLWFDSDIIVTIDESLGIQNASTHLMYETLYKYCWDNPYIFKDKIIKALDILEYTKVYNHILNGSFYPEEDNNIKIKPDELGIFIHYYGKTLKK